MTEINFQPIFDYMDQKFAAFKVEILTEVRAELFDIKADIANIYSQLKEIREEMSVLNYRTKRLEDWAKPVGNKLNIPFET